MASSRDLVKLFLQASLDNDVEKVKRLIIEGLDVNAMTEGDTILLNAVERNRIDIIRILLSSGATINLPGLYGDTPLRHAARRGYNEIIQQLLNAGANINLATANGCTPLCFAVKNGQIKSAQLLLKAGADVNIVENDGDTALSNALISGRLDIISLLLRAGVDIQLVLSHPYYNQPWFKKIRDNLAPYLSEIENKKNLVVAVNELRHCSSSLFSFMPSDLLKYYVGPMVMHFSNTKMIINQLNVMFLDSVINNHIDQASILKDLGADINAASSGGSTALHLAIPFNRWEIVQLLVSAGANLDAQDRFNNTPLNLAIDIGKDQIAELLISAGASINSSGKFSRLPLESAARNNNHTIIQLLLSAGADINLLLSDPDYNKPSFKNVRNNIAPFLADIKKQNMLRIDAVRKLRHDSLSFISYMPRDLLDAYIDPMVRDSSKVCLRK